MPPFGLLTAQLSLQLQSNIARVLSQAVLPHVLAKPSPVISMFGPNLVDLTLAGNKVP